MAGEDAVELVNRTLDIYNGDIDEETAEKAKKAAEDGDSKTVGLILAGIFAAVGAKVVGYPLRQLDPEAFGRKVGWLEKEPRETKQVRSFLTKYARELAEPAMESFLSYAAMEDDVEVERTTTGDTCEWCLARAGLWSGEDAAAFGVYKKHPGCDCHIEMRRSADGSERQ